MMFCMTYTCLYSESEHMYCMYCKTYAHKILYNLHLSIQCTHVLYVTMFCMPYTCLFSVQCTHVLYSTHMMFCMPCLRSLSSSSSSLEVDTPRPPALEYIYIINNQSINQ